MNSFLKAMREAAEKGVAVSEEIGLEILKSGPSEIPEILASASLLRQRFFGDRVHLCSILNAKSGLCSEDCSFCAQSAHHQTNAEVFDLLPNDEIIAAYKNAAEYPIGHFGVVTSGKALSSSDLDAIYRLPGEYTKKGVTWCASMGCLDESKLLRLKQAGFKRFHHNLETSESFFPEVCSSHSYALRIETVRAAKNVGLEVCCGGILGLGESLEQRVEFASLLAREKVDSIPLNFLIPVAGTRMEDQDPVPPLDIIRSISMFRMLNPGAEIKVCAGRMNMRDLQSMIFYAGASGMMAGPLLTVAGRDVGSDIRMLMDLEMVPH